MTRSKNAPTGHIDIDPKVLEELFPSNNSFALHSFADDDLAAIGRIISYCAAVGALVTFYGSSTERTVCLSLRVGQRKRSLELNGDDADTTFLGGIADTLARIYLASINDGGSSQEAKEPTKRGKGGK